MSALFCILPIVLLRYYKRNTMVVFYFMVTFFIVLAGFRDPESQYNDSHNYLTLFNYGGTYLLKHVEIGYALINLLVMKMNLGFQWVILINAYSILYIRFQNLILICLTHTYSQLIA